MPPEHTETTPLLLPSNASVVSSEDNDAVDLHDQPVRPTRLANSYRRPSFVAGGRGLLLSASPIPESALRDDEAFDCVREERGLLKRNSIVSVGRGGRSRRASLTANAVADVEESWEEAVKGGKIKTSWRYELGVMTRYSV